MTIAVISQVQIAAAHDGDAELIVTLTYDNGGTTLITMDEYAVRALFDACGTNVPEELIGASWERVRDALVASSQRYAGTPATGH
ncbi:hypothetical protein K1X12_14260 [Hyphomonas sp. WL0036]|uniref:hypothetical protein n=1 Tax=Hyphomonas sediminis TaxID=2866160 RepID=UPI001C813777|nr:hypothetical protein [Hyphomonas sediminis]MBY9068072.1 hypothetical protein [Hyphomonas sediminis]